MRLAFRAPVLACAFLLSSLPLLAQKPSTQPFAEDDDPLVTLELGAATSWNTTGGAATFAPSIAAETTLVENWLEVEAGLSTFYTRNSSEYDSDFIVKKPWTISHGAEFMLGLGPSWSYTRQAGVGNNTISGEVAGDFMFWPVKRHKFGWYLEPSYERSFNSGHQQSLNLSAGLLIGFGRRK
ncbi:hypothetical protein ACFQBQ_10795 [Granulicella cerasi]|uniref:Outer membrane protein beta-barrel domain-containing protein n=1 Tax=Granulicella cerasi TaxID=741063 RepID=A0ABW1ZCY9_9BACT|nr:hypothetical protein [Granulicella cerasi]